MEFYYESISRSELGALDLEESSLSITYFSQLYVDASDWVYYNLIQTGQTSTEKIPKQLEKYHILCMEVKQNFYTFLSPGFLLWSGFKEICIEGLAQR